MRALLTGLAGVSLCMANISGIVTDTGGTAISGAAVKLAKGGQATTTGTDGRFTLAISTAILPGKNNLSSQNTLSATIHNGLLRVNVMEKSAVAITTFDLSGNALSTVRKSLDAGTHGIALPYRGAGIYLCRVKSGNRELVLKGNSVGKVSSGNVASSHGSSSNPLAKQATGAAAINDSIAVTKTGYLDYRVVVKNSDTSGIVIKMIANTGTLTDADGNVYHTVKIGTQTWMVENLKTTKLNDGTAIPLVTDNAAWTALITPGYCWNNNNIANKAAYGGLYNWYTVNTGKLAPAGWHVPSDAEWTTLATYLGGLTVAGGKLKEAGLAHWQTPNTGATNETGFTALPSGYRPTSGAFYNTGTFGTFWSSTANDATSGLFRYVYYQGADMVRKVDAKAYGFSVRCLRDN
jgi:uncharacterized protein (TIGR02145 family)